jgi:cell wall-associated NlpC family hydrolase
MRRLVSRAAVLGTTVGLISCLLVGPSTPASAEPRLANAKARAAALSEQVRELEVRSEVAAERYNEANAELQQIVNQYVLAERAADDADLSARQATGVQVDRIRAVYMAGGQAALFASVLDSGDIAEVIDRVGTVDALVNADRHRSQVAAADADRAHEASKDLEALSLKRTDLQQKVSAARDEVTALLAERQSALSTANAEVVQIAQQLERERQERAAAAARARLEELDLLQTGTLNGTEGELASPYAGKALIAARSQLGEPYLWGGTGPDAWDCSGLVQWAYRQAGVNLDRTSRQQWFNGPTIALKDLRAGDLIFWALDTSNPATIHHVAMYSGNGRMIEAPRTGLNVREIPVYLDHYIGAIRPGVTAPTV